MLVMVWTELGVLPEWTRYMHHLCACCGKRKSRGELRVDYTNVGFVCQGCWQGDATPCFQCGAPSAYRANKLCRNCFVAEKSPPETWARNYCVLAKAQELPYQEAFDVNEFNRLFTKRMRERKMRTGVEDLCLTSRHGRLSTKEVK